MQKTTTIIKSMSIKKKQTNTNNKVYRTQLKILNYISSTLFCYRKLIINYIIDNNKYYRYFGGKFASISSIKNKWCGKES